MQNTDASDKSRFRLLVVLDVYTTRPVVSNSTSLDATDHLRLSSNVNELRSFIKYITIVIIHGSRTKIYMFKS